MEEFHESVSDAGARTAATPQKAQAQQAVNTEALIIGRELAGLTQTELANLVKLSQAKISRFEDGISQPSPHEIAVLAFALHLPERFFYRADVKRSVFNSFYRKRKSVSQKALMQFNANICLRQIQIDRLLEKVEIDAEPLPRFDPDDYKGGLKQVATSLRQLLKLPPGPIRGLVRPLEDIGVVVVIDDFGIAKLDGVSTFSNKKIPIIFLNSQAPPSRRRFSLAHEFAHSVLHTYMRPDVDEQADALASEILMPAEEIKADMAYDALTLDRLADLKLRWRVSMSALLFRAKALGFIDQRRYYYLYAQMSSAGYRIREPGEEYIQDESPTLERELVSFHREELRYSSGEIADALDLTESAVEQRYGPGEQDVSHEPKLKVI